MEKEKEMTKKVKLKKIETNENIRTELGDLTKLMQSIQQVGLEQKPAVEYNKKEDTYEVVYGNRRIAAVKKLGWKELPVKIYKDLTETDRLLLNAAENIQRQDISPIELSNTCEKLYDLGLSTGEIATKLSIPKTRVKKACNVMDKLTEKQKKDTGFINGSEDRKGKIPVSVANAIAELGLSKKKTQKLWETARKREFSVADIELISALLKDGATLEKAIENKNKWTSAVPRRLFVIKEEYKEKIERCKAKNQSELILGIVRGEYEPFKRVIGVKEV